MMQINQKLNYWEKKIRLFEYIIFYYLFSSERKQNIAT